MIFKFYVACSSLHVLRTLVLSNLYLQIKTLGEMQNFQTKTYEELKTQHEELKTQHEELKFVVQAKNKLLNNVTSLLTSMDASLSELPPPCKQPTNSSLGGADCDVTTEGGPWTVVQVCICVCMCVCMCV